MINKLTCAAIPAMNEISCGKSKGASEAAKWFWSWSITELVLTAHSFYYFALLFTCLLLLFLCVFAFANFNGIVFRSFFCMTRWSWSSVIASAAVSCHCVCIHSYTVSPQHGSDLFGHKLKTRRQSSLKSKRNRGYCFNSTKHWIHISFSFVCRFWLFIIIRNQFIISSPWLVHWCGQQNPCRCQNTLNWYRVFQMRAIGWAMDIHFDGNVKIFISRRRWSDAHLLPFRRRHVRSQSHPLFAFYPYILYKLSAFRSHAWPTIKLIFIARVCRSAMANLKSFGWQMRTVWIGLSARRRHDWNEYCERDNFIIQYKYFDRYNASTH